MQQHAPNYLLPQRHDGRKQKRQEKKRCNAELLWRDSTTRLTHFLFHSLFKCNVPGQLDFDFTDPAYPTTAAKIENCVPFECVRALVMGLKTRRLRFRQKHTRFWDLERSSLKSSGVQPVT